MLGVERKVNFEMIILVVLIVSPQRCPFPWPSEVWAWNWEALKPVGPPDGVSGRPKMVRDNDLNGGP